MKALICTPADSAEWVAAGSTFGHRCSICGVRVVITPAGRALLRREPEVPVICAQCFRPDAASTVETLESPAEIAKAMREAQPNFWRRRN